MIRLRRNGGLVSFLIILAVAGGSVYPAIKAQAAACTGTGGDVTISTACTFAPGTYTYTGTLTVSAAVTFSAAGQVILQASTIDITSGGSINADGKGYSSPGGGSGGGSGSYGGGGYGGNGGTGTGTGVGGATYGSVSAPVDMGSGSAGGNGAPYYGGGAIKLVATTGSVTIGGPVSANGTGGTLGGNSGGSGGSIWIVAPIVAGTSTLTSNGGNGGTTGGSGGGGRIAITGYTTYTYSGTVSVISGSHTTATARGGAGTFFRQSATATYGDLTVDNGSASTGNGPTTQVASTNATFDNITIRNAADYVIPSGDTLTLASGGTLTGGGTTRASVTVNAGGTFAIADGTPTFSNLNVTNLGTLTGGDLALTSATYTHAGTLTGGLTSLTVNSGGIFRQQNSSQVTVSGAVIVAASGSLTHTANTSGSLTYGLNLSAASVDIQSGATVTGDGLGAPSGAGTGYSATGGAYGGNGGNNTGTTYGSVTAPNEIGSGGGAQAGGGFVKLMSTGGFNIAGTITANGGSSAATSPGSGGAVYLSAGTLYGAGTITANGGASTGSFGGGGGRIALYYATDSSTLVSGNKIHAYGGTGGSTTYYGGSGTVYLKQDAAANGDLLVDNNNVGATNNTTQVASTNATYDNITIRNGADYVVPSASTLAMASGGTLTGGGSQRPTVTVNAGGTLTPVGVTVFSSLDITNSGTLNGNGDLTLASATYTHAGTITGGLSSLTLNSGGMFVQKNNSTISVSGAVTVNSGGRLTHAANVSSAKTYGLDISASSIDIASGGVASSDALGAPAGTGTCGASSVGGCYGGNGGNNTGTTYGSVTAPNEIGSGGTSFAGGGFIKLVASGTLNVSGTISANGGGVSGTIAPGSGGAVYLSAGTLTGAGTITANGGSSSGVSTGAGGGGRIAVYASTDSSSLLGAFDKVHAYGGADSTYTAYFGGAGTVFTRIGAASYGDLLVDNNNVGATNNTTQVASTTATFDAITIRNGADYVIPSGATLADSNGGTLSGSGSQVPTLTISSGSSFSAGAASFTFSGTSVTHAGSINTATSLTVQNGTLTESGGTFGSALAAFTLNSSGTMLFTSVTGSPFASADVLVDSTGTFTQNSTNVFSVASFTVKSGGTANHTANAGTKSYILSVSAGGDIDIQSGATVNVDGSGYDSATGPAGTFGSNSANGGGGGGHGGNGGTGYLGVGAGAPHDSVTAPTDLGSGGGTNGSTAGGAGGGYVKFVAGGTLNVASTISAKGQNGPNNATGGGAGGSIYLSGGTLSGSGTVTVIGGNGNGGSGGGGGAGGRIAIYYSAGSLTLTKSVYGGTASNTTNAQGGGSGTIYVFGPGATSGDLTVDANNITNNANTTQLSGTNSTFDNITIKNSADYVIPSGDLLTIASTGALTGGTTGTKPLLTVSSGGTFVPPTGNLSVATLDITNLGTFTGGAALTLVNSTFIQGGTLTGGLTGLSVGASGTYQQQTTSTQTISGNVTVQSTGNLTHTAYAGGSVYVLDLNVTGNIDIQSGGTVNADSKGYTSGTGPAGTFGTSNANGGGGGGHGGNGGTGAFGTGGGSPHDLVKVPAVYGSGGGGNSTSTTGGSGGGYVKLVTSGTLTATGTISANGQTGPNNATGGGAGGTIYISAGALSGSGIVSAIGGNGTGGSGGGGGGGGRVAVYYSSGTLGTLTIRVYGGTTNNAANAQSGGAGTSFTQGPGQSNGSLTVDANAMTTIANTTQVTTTSQTYDAITVSGKAIYVIPASYILSAATGGTLTLNNATITNNNILNLPVSGTSAFSTNFHYSGSGTFNATGDLVVDNGTYFMPWTTGTTAGRYNGMTLNTSGIFEQTNTGTATFDGAVTVNSGGKIQHTATSGASKSAGVDIYAATVSINGTGTINVVGKGFASNSGGTGCGGAGSGAAGGGGGGHGGRGGAGTLGAAGATSDSASAPVLPGGCGGYGSATTTGGAGGGAIKVTTTGDMVLAGTITANGNAGAASYGGGGAGGSVWLTVGGNLTGSGTITANGGGVSTSGAGCGGGGRIYGTYYGSGYTGSTPTVAAGTGASCTGGQAGQAGSMTFTALNAIPVVTSATHSPTSPTPTDSVVLSCGATDDVGITKLEIYVDGTAPGNLVQTCNITPTATPATCDSVGATYALGAHTVTVRAYDDQSATGDGFDSFSVSYAAPTISSLSPSTTPAGSGSLTLTVYGTGFAPTGTVVKWNGSSRTTTYVSPTQVTAFIPTSDLVSAGSVPVTVFNPTPGGGTSSSSTFTIASAAPTLTSFSPSVKRAGNPAFTITVTGTNFTPTSSVRVNGQDRPTTYVSGTQLTATVATADIAAAGTVPVTVYSPADGGQTSNSQNITVYPVLSTVTNSTPLSRLRVSEAAELRLDFELRNPISGLLTVTMPVGFTVTGPFTGGSACLSGFGFTGNTLTATKTDCSGIISLTGALVTNPAIAGEYVISWVNDDPGFTVVYIIPDDQVNVSATVEPYMTFNVGVQAATATCDGTYAGAGGTVALGVLAPTSVTSSDVGSVAHVCTRLSTNGTGGAVVTVKSSYGALRSSSASADQISSATATLTSGLQGYGLCVGSSGGHTGTDSTVPVGASPVAAAPFASSCTASAHSVGALTVSTQTVWSLSSTTQNAFARIFLKAEASYTTPAHDDYTDTLTFIATGTY